MLVTRITCPHCDAVLKSTAGVESGKTILCPKCKERFTVSAPRPAKKPAADEPEEEDREDRVRAKRSPARLTKPARQEEEDEDQDEQEDDAPPARTKAKAKAARADDEDDHEDDDDERPARRKKVRLRKRKSSAALLVGLIIGGVVLLVGGGVGLYFLLRKPAATDPAVVEKDGDKTPPEKRKTDYPPGVDPKMADDLASRLVGTWWNDPEAIEKVRYVYKADGTFMIVLTTPGSPDSVVNGTWKIVRTGKMDGKLDYCMLHRAGSAAAGRHFTPNDHATVAFHTNDMIAHSDSDGVVMYFHRPGTSAKPPREIVGTDPANPKSDNEGKILGKWRCIDSAGLFPPGAEMRVEFTADGKFHMTVNQGGGEQTLTADYTLGRGALVSFVNFNQPLAGGATRIEDQVTITGDDMIMKEPDGRIMRFKRGILPPSDKPPPSDPGASGAPSLTVEEFAKAWLADKDAAPKQYAGKIVVLSGTVDHTSDRYMTPNPPIIWLEVPGMEGIAVGKKLSVSVQMARHSPQVERLAKGQQVTVRGQFHVFIAPTNMSVDEADLQTAGPDPTNSVTAIQLTKDYSASENEADGKYQKKSLAVSGVVAEINEERSHILLEGFDEKAGKPVRVICSYAPIRKAEFAGLRKGQSVQIKGVCEGIYPSFDGQKKDVEFHALWVLKK
jgi:hypothetical protein